MPASTTRSLIAIAIAVGTLSASTLIGHANPIVSRKKSTYADVQNIFNANCKCHLARKPAGVDLSSYKGLMAGGNGGPNVKPGDAANSILIKAMRSDPSMAPMPPNGQLPDGTIKVVEDWINAGALPEGGAPPVPDVPKPPYVGKQYMITFPGDAGKETVMFIAEKSLKVNHFGDAGPETVTNTRDEIRPNVFMVSWQEKDKSIVTQVEDLEKNVAYQTTASDGKITHLVGDMKLAGE